mmetsp:Transcript_3672/g.11389  ORF Transcript_3672/g.11389 Transcript_3672/m.11389 type:complete len:134 (-) Transcript_3672:362-763(-)
MDLTTFASKPADHDGPNKLARSLTTDAFQKRPAQHRPALHKVSKNYAFPSHFTTSPDWARRNAARWRAYEASELPRGPGLTSASSLTTTSTGTGAATLDGWLPNQLMNMDQPTPTKLTTSTRLSSGTSDKLMD